MCSSNSGDLVGGHGEKDLLSGSPHVVEHPTPGHLPGSATISISPDGEDGIIQAGI